MFVFTDSICSCGKYSWSKPPFTASSGHVANCERRESVKDKEDMAPKRPVRAEKALILSKEERQAVAALAY